MNRFLAVAAALLLTSCANITPRNSEPKATLISHASLDATTTCVVSALDAEFKNNGFGAPSFTHAATIIAPGKEYEVRPQQMIAEDSEVYYLRVRAQAGGTAIVVYTLPFADWESRIKRATAHCGSA